MSDGHRQTVRTQDSGSRTGVQAILLDFGHTLVNYEADEAALLESYRDIHAFLEMAGISREPIPDDRMPHHPESRHNPR